jgi:hypothetical protein
MPDPSTLRRWALRKLLSLHCGIQTPWWWLAWRNFWRAPTIFAWDWAAMGRNLRLEVTSP